MGISKLQTMCPVQRGKAAAWFQLLVVSKGGAGGADVDASFHFTGEIGHLQFHVETPDFFRSGCAPMKHMLKDSVAEAPGIGSGA